MRLLLVGIVTILSLNLAAQSNKIFKANKPEWVNIVEGKERPKEEGLAYNYQLIDQQINIPTQTSYFHYQVKVLNPKGIQEISDLSFVFDPSYQTLTIHELKVSRDGQTIDKLKNGKINTIQRETGLERSLYDGSLTAVINLTDIREGDIIEYAFSRKGFNPIGKGNYSNTFYHEYSLAVNRIYNRIIIDKKKKLTFKQFMGAKKPEIIYSNNKQEHIWDITPENIVLYDNNVPGWYNGQQRISVTTFDSWSDVVEWALPLYDYKPAETKNIKIPEKYKYASKKNITNIIRFVQDDIRYLGFESGIGAYKPNKPYKVYEQKYGDCKDKSLLLVSLLRREGLEAYPLLVNTLFKNEVNEFLPSQNAFDHCIVNFRLDNKDYFIDPTISNQGGILETLSTPNYKTGLRIKKGETELIEISEATSATVLIKELITVDSVGYGATADFIVRTEYTGSKADYIRSYFSNNSRESVKKEYLNYYSNIYPEIESVGEVKFLDYERNTSNKVIVEEKYKINNIWEYNTDSSMIYIETYPIVLASSIEFTNSPKRSMPYYTGQKFAFKQETIVEMPESWPVQNNDVSIVGENFGYRNSIKGNYNTITMEHEYHIDSEYIQGDEAQEFINKHEKIKSELTTYIQQTLGTVGSLNGDDGFKISWTNFLFAVMIIVFCLVAMIRINKEFDPIPMSASQDLSIGGWLVLPAIGLVFSLLFSISSIISADYFDAGIMNTLVNNGYEGMVWFIRIELILNTISIMFTILVLVQFFQRRSSLPKLIIFLFTYRIVLQLIDNIAAFGLFPDLYTVADKTEGYGEIARSIIAGAIWIPYFNISERVKNTFVKTIRKANLFEDTDDVT